MISEQLTRHVEHPAASLYEITPQRQSLFRRFIASTRETRQICNDPFVVGVDYTDKLETACERVLRHLSQLAVVPFVEHETCVLHILRGGLNFGLRNALAHAFHWNFHSAAFLSSQRARQVPTSSDWVITENSYQKIALPKRATIVFGDVVATGTSLEHGIRRLVDEAKHLGVEIVSWVFFTIGGPRAEEIIAKTSSYCYSLFPHYHGAVVVYFEGRFAVEHQDDSVLGRISGTDLLRTASLLAPEFITSQADSPSYPIERCTIYDAGSRAFWLKEYLEDVESYWRRLARAADRGMTFEELLKLRYPEGQGLFGEEVSLEEVCEMQLQKVENLQTLLEGRKRLDLQVRTPQRAVR